MQNTSRVISFVSLEIAYATRLYFRPLLWTISTIVAALGQAVAAAHYFIAFDAPHSLARVARSLPFRARLRYVNYDTPVRARLTPRVTASAPPSRRVNLQIILADARDSHALWLKRLADQLAMSSHPDEAVNLFRQTLTHQIESLQFRGNVPSEGLMDKSSLGSASDASSAIEESAKRDRDEVESSGDRKFRGNQGEIVLEVEGQVGAAQMAKIVELLRSILSTDARIEIRSSESTVVVDLGRQSSAVDKDTPSSD